MAEKIISEFFDLPKIKAEINEIAAEMSKKFGSAANINTLGGKSTTSKSGGQKAEFDAVTEAAKRLTKSMQELQVQQQAVNAEMQKNNVTRSQNNAQAKLSATIASENATSLQKLYAQMKLLEIEMQSKFNPALKEQSKEFQNLNAQHAKLQQEYQRTARATGVMGRSMNSTYGSTFQLTQVMRELPNFAIDARIGFMALSNNLPMLADSFKQLKQQIIDTEGAAGASRKTWAAFGKSLLSLNTIMIVASTLLVLFGDDIIEAFTGKVPAAQKSLDDFTKALKENSTEMTSVIKSISDMNVLLNNIDSKYITSEEVLKQYNSTLGETFGKETDIAGVRQALVEKGDAYIDIVLRLSKAHFIQANAISMVSEAYALENDKKVAWYQNIWESVKSFAGGKTMIEAVIAGTSGQIRGKRMSDAEKLMKDAKEELKRFNKDIDAIYKDAAKKGIDLNGKDDPKKTKGSKTSKQFTEINITREYYKSEEEMMRRLASLQNDITRENEQGELNSYEKRRKAAELYYSTVISMAMGEQNVAIANELSSTQSQISGVKTKYTNNKKKFKKGSPEDIKNDKQYADALKTIEANKNDAILKINDEYTKKVIEAEKKKAKEILAIDDDMYKEKVYYIEQEAKLTAQLQGELDKQQSLGGAFISKLGLNKYKGMQDAANSRARSMDEIREKLKGAKGTDKENLERQLEFEANQDLMQKELDAIQITEDAKASIVENSIDTLQSLWDGYYEYLEEKIDEQLKKDTKVNDERLAQYEDETKAGLHTAEELDRFKERSISYQTSLEEEAARKKAELDKQQFLIQQAFALGQIWLNFAMTEAEIARGSAAIVSQTGAAGLVIAPTYAASASAWNLASALAASAAVAARTIPAFAEGGDMPFSGKAMLGDGGKHELAISPSGKMFISDNTPKLYELEKGTHIFPDVNKVDLMSVLAMKQVMPNLRGDNRTEAILQSIDKSIKSQKQGNFYGMPLIRQMNMSQRYYSRKRGLMN